ncbi:MAG: anaerobic ribonucleoside triphosphate reductase [Clostridiales bacterium]|jgi:ribonucleoside-triphosphate reductase|nr:anaerobic ribonucleoside triphosphate reductase [Clostridiales bacterium]
MFAAIQKRDGRKVPYDIEKIAGAINKAMTAAGRKNMADESMRLALLVQERLRAQFKGNPPGIEDIQDIVEAVLMDNGYAFVAKRYILYRAERSRARERNTSLMRIFDELTFKEADDSDMKRDNANIDGDTAMGVMLKYGSEGAKNYYEKYLLSPALSKAHAEGDIHIHDFDFYALTTTCCQIDIVKLFTGGFSTGHGHLREPNSIQSYAALACIAIQSNQNDQHGGQSIPNFDYGLAPGVKKTFKKLYIANLSKAVNLLCGQGKTTKEAMRAVIGEIGEKYKVWPGLFMGEEYIGREAEALKAYTANETAIKSIQRFAREYAAEETEREVAQAMEALVHNLNTMHSRAGAQTPFSSINYGTDTSPEGRMITRNVLLATDQGLGNGETAIFPIHIFKVKEGVNYNPGDPNYDLFKLACRVSARRLFPNFGFLDAPFNLAYYRPGRPETEVVYMGCRTRVIGNVYDRDNEITYGRGNLSFTSINLPRVAIKSCGSVEWFFEELERKLQQVTGQLVERYQIQAVKKVRNFPFLMGQGIWLGSDGLGLNDEVGEILKHGTLSVGFIGLAEALVALCGSHHGQTPESRNLGLEIVGYMRDYLDRLSAEKQLNFTLLATPAEGLSGRFVRLDKKKFGDIPGVTDREYYTNGFHIPVYFPISAYEKIKIEAPYHALTNAGHITYVELDGDASNNVQAFERVVRAMKEAGVGYGSVNHPVDRDPVCGYNGIIDETCPGCGRKEREGPLKFERIRRITGYLVGTLDRFNDAKRAEEADRVKHDVG